MLDTPTLPLHYSCHTCKILNSISEINNNKSIIIISVTSKNSMLDTPTPLIVHMHTITVFLQYLALNKTTLYVVIFTDAE